MPRTCTTIIRPGPLGRTPASLVNVVEERSLRKDRREGMMLFLTVLLVPSIHTDFEGGSLGKVEKVSETHYRLAAKGETDRDGRNRQANWYYFRVDDAPLKPLRFDIVNLPGEYNYKPNQG